VRNTWAAPDQLNKKHTTTKKKKPVVVINKYTYNNKTTNHRVH